MNQLMSHHPVIVEILLCRVLAYPNASEGRKSPHATPCCAVPHSLFARSKLDEDASSGNGKSTVVNRNGFGSVLDPLHDAVRREIRRAWAKVELNR